MPSIRRSDPTTDTTPRVMIGFMKMSGQSFRTDSYAAIESLMGDRVPSSVMPLVHIYVLPNVTIPPPTPLRP